MNQLDTILKRLDELEERLSSEKTILSINEVSILTGISKSTIYKLTSQHKIPHYKRVKQLMFDKKEILEWIKEGKIEVV